MKSLKSTFVKVLNPPAYSLGERVMLKGYILHSFRRLEIPTPIPDDVECVFTNRIPTVHWSLPDIDLRNFKYFFYFLFHLFSTGWRYTIQVISTKEKYEWGYHGHGESSIVDKIQTT